MITGLVVAPDATVTPIELGGPDDGLGAMQRAVGGYIEALPIPLDPPLILWANEDGLALHLPINSWATMFVGDTIVGTVILTGGPDGLGGVRSIPEMWLVMGQ
jgi:hypothetical protein